MLGIIVGATLYFNQNVVVKREVVGITVPIPGTKYDTITVDGKKRVFTDAKISYHNDSFCKEP
jgi:hypothetical protein